MPRPPARASSLATALTALASWTLTAALLLAASAARAQPRSPLFEFDSLAEPGYELRLSLGYYSAERLDFRQLVFLVAQPVERISVAELRSELDLRISITRRLAVQAVLPFSLRSADIALQDVVVSRSQVLDGRTVTVSRVGLADPTLALADRLFEAGSFRLQVDLGTRVPIDDNPGSPVLAEQLPLGTGQHHYFIGTSASLRAGRLDIALGYRFEYNPGSSATYLVREVSKQGYTSGALDTFTAHRVSAELAYVFDHMWSARLAPDFRADEQPSLVESSGTTPFLVDRFRFELLFEASIEARFGWQNALRLGYSQPVLFASDVDPFFPINVPEQGVRLTWLFSAR
jgi:hypothetical protein